MLLALGYGILYLIAIGIIIIGVSAISFGETIIGTVMSLIGVALIASFYKSYNRKVSDKKEKDRKNYEKILDEHDFNLDKIIDNYGQHIAVDDTNKKFALFYDPLKNLKIFEYDDLIDFELIEDGETITKGKTMQTVAGGLAFGVFGAIVGASGKRKNKSVVNDMRIQIHINDLHNPNIEIPFINHKTKKKSLQYKQSAEKAKEILSTLKYIQNENENKESEQTN